MLPACFALLNSFKRAGFWYPESARAEQAFLFISGVCMISFSKFFFFC